MGRCAVLDVGMMLLAWTGLGGGDDAGAVVLVGARAAAVQVKSGRVSVTPSLRKHHLPKPLSLYL